MACRKHRRRLAFRNSFRILNRHSCFPEMPRTIVFTISSCQASVETHIHHSCLHEALFHIHLLVPLIRVGELFYRELRHHGKLLDDSSAKSKTKSLDGGNTNLEYCILQVQNLESSREELSRT